MPLIAASLARSLAVEALAFILLGAALLWLKSEIDILFASYAKLAEKYESLQKDVAALRARKGRDPEREPWSVCD